MMIRLVFASLSNRRVVVLLTSVSVALAVFLFTSVERLRVGARQSFTQTISGTHIIVGARTGQIPLLLSSLFHIGAPTQNISYRTFLKYKRHAAVSWAVPLSMGDSYRGFRVVGTTPDIFRYYRYGNRRPIELKTGALTLTRFKAVLGSSAARTLALRVGDKIILTHGISDAQGINDHEENPFVVEAILKPTGTPFDKGIYVSLDSVELMHDEKTPEEEGHGEHLLYASVKIQKISSVLLGVKEPIDILPLMRAINEDPSEPLTAILPGVALSEIWNIMGYVEGALQLVSLLVMLTALCGLFIALYASLAERYREMAILRALGASPLKIASLLLAESLILTLSGIFLGYTLFYGASVFFAGALFTSLSVATNVFLPSVEEIIFISLLLTTSALVAMVPAAILYRRALGEGLKATK